MPRAGILALQGDFAAHARMLDAIGIEQRFVRRPEQLEGLDMLCLPGGESTTMSMLLDASGLREPLTAAIRTGLPVLATCAGMILLARGLKNDSGSVQVRPLGLLDATIDRNAYGRQVDSFEDSIRVDWAALDSADSGPMNGVFIRAPRILEHGESAREVAWHGGECVMLRQGNILAAAFHPEIALDPRLHSALAALAEGR